MFRIVPAALSNRQWSPLLRRMMVCVWILVVAGHWNSRGRILPNRSSVCLVWRMGNAVESKLFSKRSRYLNDSKLTSSFINRSSSGGNFLPPRADRLLSIIDDAGLFDLAMGSARDGTVLLFIDVSVFDGDTAMFIWDSSSDLGDVPNCSSFKLKLKFSS